MAEDFHKNPRTRIALLAVTAIGLGIFTFTPFSQSDWQQDSFQGNLLQDNLVAVAFNNKAKATPPPAPTPQPQAKNDFQLPEAPNTDLPDMTSRDFMQLFPNIIKKANEMIRTVVKSR